MKSWICLSSLPDGSIFIDDKVVNVQVHVVYVDLLAFVFFELLLMFGLCFQILVLLSPVLKLLLDTFCLATHVCLGYLFDIFGVFPELLSEISKAHPGLVKFSIVAELDLLCQILLQEEDVVLEQSQLPCRHI